MQILITWQKLERYHIQDGPNYTHCGQTIPMQDIYSMQRDGYDASRHMPICRVCLREVERMEGEKGK